MRLPDLSRLAQAPTSVLATMDEWEREDRRVAAVGGQPSPPSDDEDGDDSEQESSPAGGSAIRRLYIGLHAGGNHDAEGFLIVAMKVAGKALLTVPVGSWGKKITETYGNSYGFEEAVKVKLETWFKQDARVTHYDVLVARRCELTKASASCDTAEAKRYALTFKIMFALQPMLADAPAVKNAMKGAIGLLVASYQKDISSGLLPVVWLTELSEVLMAPPAAPPDHQTPIRALFNGSGAGLHDKRAGIRKLAFLWCLQWMVHKVTARLWQEDLALVPSKSAIAQVWAGSGGGLVAQLWAGRGGGLGTPAEKFARWVNNHVQVSILDLGHVGDDRKHLTAADMLDKSISPSCALKLSLHLRCDLVEEQKRYLETAIMSSLEEILKGGDALVRPLTQGVRLLIDEYERAPSRPIHAFKTSYTTACEQTFLNPADDDAVRSATTEYLESDTEAEAPAAPPSLPDPPPNPNDALVVLDRFMPVLGEPWLDFHDTYVVRSDPRMAAAFALFCYKKSWDKPLAYAYRGVPVAQYLKALGPLQDDQKDARVPGLLAFLPLRMLRKLATEYVRGPAQEISQVLPAHRADDYSIRASAKASPQLQAWAQGADVQPRLTKLLDALPPDGLKLRPASRGDECNLRVELDASKWGVDADEAAALIRELRTRSHQAVGYNVTEKGHVYPLYNCAWSVLETSQSETCYTGRASAQLLLGACIERMLASLDPLMSRVGETGDKTWRGVRQGRYGWVEAAGDDDELWAARLIETLQATHFSVSTEESVARGGYFLGSGPNPNQVTFHLDP